MITEQDLQEAIAECEGQKKPTSNTCIKLAAFYTIKEHLFPTKAETPVYRSNRAYMDAGDTKEPVVYYNSGSEFSSRINGRKAFEMWSIMDELMDALIAVDPRLYESVMRKIK